ncbi:uncharacterized protein RHOBADRAFT_55209 [Rhodotorula graminis WP1]|uniref:Uncharacterized protein n=1 Tax=Rhodotorula graminis (strain WP1) TaxID=578459 RepID=A0A0P9F0F4_RHOGW|nr:uncharacterized protein RHOBADRAFT_55209 [Rhodotorula graminis WP1]KPV72956.1 hypothetical protein RHOBADRAFT_55209 [Rhodotorula graminis WP1]
MGPQPAFAARASRPSLLPTSRLAPAPSRPLYPASETPAATPALAQHHTQLPVQTAVPPEGHGTCLADPAPLISTSPRPSPSRQSDDRRVPPVADALDQSLSRAVRLARGDDDRGRSLGARRLPKGLERRSRTSERRRAVADGAGAGVSLDRRQWQIPQAEGYPSCYYVDLSVFTCYPESNTTLVQDDYSLAIWNSAQPSFISRGRVDVYLYNADTQNIATSWRNESNAQGMIGIVPDDPWWPAGQTAQQWFGDSARNRSTPYFFVVVPAGDTLTGGEVHGATFTAIQTAAPTSLSSALAALTTSSLSSSPSVSSASLASVSSISSLSAASASSASASGESGSGSSRSTSRSGPGSLQNESSSGGPSIPNYAIALIAVLGFLALLAGAIAVYCCLGRGRRRRRQDEAAAAAAAAAGAGRRGASSGDLTDLGSTEPMLGGAAGAGATASAGTRESRASSRAAPPAGILGAGALGGAAAGGAAAAAAAGGKDLEKDDDNTLSQSDAARMAEAFRAALRKPEYAPAVPAVAPPLASSVGSGASAGPGAGPSPTGAPEGTDSSGSGGSGEGNGVGRGIMEEELRSEGKSMRSVEGGGRRWGRTG